MVAIAVIIVNFRSSQETILCLESFERTDSEKLKFFLIDNGSGDGSVEALLDYLADSPLSVSFHTEAENRGFAAGANIGLRNALGEGFRHLLLLNNDVTVLPDFTKALQEACAAHPVAVVAGRILHAQEGLPTANVGRFHPLTWRVRYFPDLEGEAPIGIDFVSGCLMLIPAEVLKRVGFLDERFFMYCEDVEFCLRLKRKDIPIAHFPELRIWHKVSASVDKSGLAKEYYYFRNQTFISWHLGSWVQKLCYGTTALLVLIFKVRQPMMFVAFLRAMGDAFQKRMGRR